MINSGRLQRQAGRRRLRAARPCLSSTAATSRTPLPISTRPSRSRPISLPPTRTAAMHGTRAAITARRIADYDETIKLDPNSASPYVNRATVRRDLGYTDGALEDYRKGDEPRAAIAPRPIAGAGRFICARKITRAPSPISTAPYSLRRTPTITCCAAQAREGAGDLDRALSDYQRAAQARSEKRRRLYRAGRHLAQEGQSRQGARGIRPRGDGRPERADAL